MIAPYYYNGNQTERLRRQNSDLKISTDELKKCQRLTDLTGVGNNGSVHLKYYFNDEVLGGVFSIFKSVVSSSAKSQGDFYAFLEGHRLTLFNISEEKWNDQEPEILTLFRENIELFNTLVKLSGPKLPLEHKWVPIPLPENLIERHFEKTIKAFVSRMNLRDINALKQHRISDDPEFKKQLCDGLQMEQNIKSLLMPQEWKNLKIGRFSAIFTAYKILYQIGKILNPQHDTFDSPPIDTYLSQLRGPVDARTFSIVQAQAKQIVAIPGLKRLYPRTFRIVEGYTHLFPMNAVPMDIQRLILNRIDYPVPIPSSQWMILGFAKWKTILKNEDFFRDLSTPGLTEPTSDAFRVVQKCEHFVDCFTQLVDLDRSDKLVKVQLALIYNELKQTPFWYRNSNYHYVCLAIDLTIAGISNLLENHQQYKIVYK